MPFKPIKFIKNILLEVLSNHELRHHSVSNILYRKAMQNSSEYADNNMKDAMMFFDHHGIWDYTISRIETQTTNGYLLEFGVFQATSINYFAEFLTDKTLYGFDSFEGLQEDWKGWSLRKGAFNLHGKMPNVKSNVALIKGWFNKTLPEFINKNKIDFVQFLHIDSDTYEAAATVFELLNDSIKPGTLILFDEYFGYRGWEIGEYKAFKEFIDQRQLTYQYLAFSNCQVLVEIKA